MDENTLQQSDTANIEMTERDRFILSKRKAGYKIHEIQILLKNEGFVTPHRATIYNILAKYEMQ